jgi:hypothetical protein
MVLYEGGDACIASRLTVRDVAYSPQLATPLLALVDVVDDGHKILFDQQKATIIKADTGGIVAVVPRVGNLYMIKHKEEEENNLKEKQTKHHRAFGVSEIEQKETTQETAQATSLPSSSSLATVSEAASSIPAIVVDRSHLPQPVAVLPPFQLFHARMGHASVGVLQRLLLHSSVNGLEKLQLPSSKEKHMQHILSCTGCEYGKSHRLSFDHTSSVPKATRPLGRWVMDIVGPVKVEKNSLEDVLNEGEYLSVVVDEYSGMIWVSCMKKKSDVDKVLMKLHRHQVVAAGVPLQCVHTDGGGEYNSKELLSYWDTHGVTVTSTPAHTPQRNGKAERTNRTLFEHARAMLHHSHLPDNFWRLAVKTAAYLLNRSTSTGAADSSKTAEELMKKKKPSIHHLRVFGCDCYVHIPDEDRKKQGKMAAKAREAIFVGYDEEKHAYRCLLIEERKLISSRDVRFVENSFTHSKLLHHELARESELEENNAIDSHARAQAGDADDDQRVGSSGSSSAHSRRAARAATHRLMQPWSEEEEFNQIKRATEKSKQQQQQEQEEIQKQTSKQQEEKENIIQLHAHSDEEEEETKQKQKTAKEKKSQKKSEQQKESSSSSVSATSWRRSLRPRVGVLDYSSAMSVLPVGVVSTPDPTTFKEAMDSPARDHWLHAMREELRSLHAHHTWSLVPMSVCTRAGRKPIPSKWVFKTKLKSDGSIERYKARLVAVGTGMRPGVEYGDTFAPVMKGKTLRVIMHIAAVKDWHLHHLDVQTAFLNGEIEEEVYMRVPPGLDTIERGGEKSSNDSNERKKNESNTYTHEHNHNSPQVCRLHKALYGTKQASAVWHTHIKTTLLQLGFQACQADECAYVLQPHSSTNVSQCKRTNIHPIILGLFVDDIICTYSKEDKTQWQRIMTALSEKYSLKDLGEAEQVLGMKLVRDRVARTITLTHQRYLDALLTEYHMADCKPAETPEEFGCQLTKQSIPLTHAEQQQMEATPYSALVGSLLYAAIHTRPDISHACSILTRYLQYPNQSHWTAAKRILRYLKGKTQLGITLGGREHKQQSSDAHSSSSSSHSTSFLPSSCTVHIYCDADWAGDLDDRRSTSGCLILLDDSPLVWFSKKQPTVALSTAEAEYMSMSAAVQEAKWLVALLEELQVLRVVLPVQLHSDNQAAISISTSVSLTHSRTKHIDLRHHYVRELVNNNWLQVSWIKTQEQLADIFTKALNKQTYKELRKTIIREHNTEETKQQKELL